MAQRQVRIYRAQPKETRIQNSIIWDKNLSSMARFTLIAMLSLPDTWDYSVRGMAVMLQINKDTMGKYLRELEAARYLKRSQPKEKGRFSNSTYIITDTPGVYGEELYPQKSDTGEENEELCPDYSDTESSPPNNPPQKRRTEQKKRTEQKPPISPKGDESDMLFERFWNAYPKARRQGKVAARKAWAKLSPDMALCRVMADALDRQKRSAEWQREGGRYIPHPSTWLNGHRWEDEFDDPPPSDEVAYDEGGQDGI